MNLSLPDGALGLGLTARHIDDEPHDEVMQVETTVEAVGKCSKVRGCIFAVLE